MRLLHEDLTYIVKGCIFEVHKELKTGLDEESYQLVLADKLKRNNISYESKPFRYLEHRGEKVHKFVPDLIIEDKLILELKNIQSDFIPANYLQIISYLKHFQIELGMLVNFGLLSVDTDRVVFSEKELILKEDYTEIEDFIFSKDKQHFEDARTAILNIFETYGLGFDYTIYKKLFKVELVYQNIPFTPSILIPVKSDERLLGNFELKIPLIANKVLCGITAGQTELNLHKRTMINYLKKTNTPIGIIANFGKNKLEIKGVSQ